MRPIDISIIRDGIVETARFEFDDKNTTLTLSMLNGTRKSCTSFDYYDCFGQIRSAFPDVKFLCKGAKINVHTSRMSSQMSRGFVAYEHELGRPCDNEDLVRIFDYDDENITNDIQAQKEHYRHWLESLRNNPNLQ